MNLIAIPLSNLSTLITIPLVVILTPLFSSAIILWAKRVVKKQNEKLDDKNFDVTFSKLTFTAMTFLVCFLAVSVILFVVLFFIAGDMPLYALIATTVGFGVCAIIALIFELLLYRWKICVRGEAVTYIPLAGKKREYNLNDVSRVETRPSGPGAYRYLIYFKTSAKKAFVFNNLMVGASLLEKRLSEISGFIFMPTI